MTKTETLENASKFFKSGKYSFLVEFVNFAGQDTNRYVQADNMDEAEEKCKIAAALQGEPVKYFTATTRK